MASIENTTTKLTRQDMSEGLCRIHQTEGAFVDLHNQRVIVTPVYGIRFNHMGRNRLSSRGLKSVFQYGPLSWVPVRRNGSPKLPEGWTFEDWRIPENHPSWPDMYIEKLPGHEAVQFRADRSPWDLEEEGVEAAIKRELEFFVPDGWTVVWKVETKNHPLEEMYRRRRRDNRMMNVIITARDSQTGTGKTSLAVELAKRWDENGWTADKGTLNPQEYQRVYHEVGEGSVLILDEAEQAADNRRSMSDQNLTLSHLWATMRFKQVSSIITLPTVTMLDKRLKELADVRIHVVRRGWGKVYKVKVEDTGEHRVFEKQIAIQRWGSMDEDADYQALSEKKAERMKDYSAGDDDDETVSEAVIERQKRNELIESMDRHDGMTHEDIAEVVGLSRPAVTQIVNNDDDG